MDDNPPLIRVLLADDHPAMRAGIRAILESVPDIQVIAEVEDGTAAQQIGAEQQPDILLLDLRMPGPSPVDMIVWMKTHCPQTAVLILTAHNLDAYLAVMMKAGAAGFLLKEETPVIIIDTVRRAAEGKTCFKFDQKTRAYRWQAEVGQRWQLLTIREQEVLALLAEGYTDQEMADALEVSKKTVGNHVGQILKKLAATSRTEAALWYEREIVQGGVV
jgi:DNA-binding NarL/FixJ family response regulator